MIKQVLYDIETFPNVLTNWDLYFKGYLSPDNIVQERSLICASWKTLGESEIHSVCVPQKDVFNDEMVVKTLYKALSDADEIIGHNADDYDLPVLRSRGVLYGLKPLPPIIQTDTYRIAKKFFRFNSNKLDYLAKYLGVGEKIKTDYSLWQRCMRGDADALEEMVTYNMNDVVLLEQIYTLLSVYAPAKLNKNLITEENNCPRCGSNRLEKRGFNYTQAGKRQRYQCKECGHWSHSGIKFSKLIRS